MVWTEKQNSTAALLIIMMVLPSIAVFIRAWACIVIKERRIGMDDVFAFATLPLVLALNGVLFWWIADGLGKHADQVSKPDYMRSSLIIFVSEYLFDVAITLPKLSALFFYHRIFQHTSPVFRVSLWILGLASVFWLIIVVFVVSFQCSPPATAWDPSVKGTCINQWTFILSTTVPSVVIDISILLMPLPLLWRLYIPLRRKLFLSVMFICGYSIVVCSVGRLVTIAKLGSNYAYDIDWLVVGFVSWVACEPAISLFSICLPIIYHFAKQVHRHGLQFAVTGRPLSPERHALAKEPSWFSFSSNRLRAELRGFVPAGETEASANLAPDRSGTEEIPLKRSSEVRVHKSVDVYQEESQPFN